MANHVTDLRLKAGFKTAKTAAIALNISTGMMYQMEEGVKKPGDFLSVENGEAV
ncbi:MAG: hypothetical protein AAGU75_14350 [Bacillota bacterium]